MDSFHRTHIVPSSRGRVDFYIHIIRGRENDFDRSHEARQTSPLPNPHPGTCTERGGERVEKERGPGMVGQKRERTSVGQMTVKICSEVEGERDISFPLPLPDSAPPPVPPDVFPQLRDSTGCYPPFPQNL